MRILFLFFCMLSLFSCSKKNTPIDGNNQRLRLCIHTEPPTLDTRKATDTSSVSIINMCFEGLMRRASDGLLVPAIAHKIEVSDDQLIYTFHLRESYWWDGKSVTAHDFEKTWKKILSPKFPSGISTELYILKNAQKAKNGKVSLDEIGVKAINDNTLKVTLERPIPYFLDLTATHYFNAVPTHISEENPNWSEDSGPLFIGNGPYKLISWRHHNHILLEKNPDYWDKESVRLDEIHLHIIEDETTELHMFESGELDWAGSPLSTLPTDALQTLSDQNRLHTYSMPGTYYYIFNVTEPPFDNKNLRKAFSLAINRKTIIENITQSQQKTATGLIPPAIWKVKKHFQDNNIEEARRLFDLALEEMGYTKKTLPQIKLSYNTSSSHHRIAQAIQEQWYRAFDIRIKLENMEWKVFLDQLSHKQFQIARMGGISGYNDPISFLDLYKFKESPNNYSGWSNPKFTQLIEEAQETVDITQRQKLLREAEALFINAMPIAPIYFYTGSFVKRNYVKGIDPTPYNDTDYKFAFLEM